MFTAIGLMLTGIALGFALRSLQWPELLGRAISPTIMLMLFALGVAVGGNKALMADLPVLGGKALVLTVACVAGSIICIMAVRRFFPGAGPRRRADAGDGSEDAGAAMSLRHDREDGEGRA
ncbi:LysO family transporter [uncultured Desulfovibrio sp.]|uniref:LysO family transporter n=1 Tax=uncultured Desulfovibrio sp. TaxID=167968 RepID=UPI00266ED35B|nr:LysO family transporter [uncultured Desulfovibrio sp.]